MNVKDIWTDKDYSEMNWHDSHIHSIAIPNETLRFSMEIDYIFKWVLDDVDGLYRFWVSPCTLVFSDTLNLKIEIDFQNTIGLSILDIKRNQLGLSPNGKIMMWRFDIETDRGYIEFESSGYKQILKKQPIFGQSQTISAEDKR